MYNSFQLILFCFLLMGCSSKQCTSEDRYNGLMNAISCDYDDHIQNLKEELYVQENKELATFVEYDQSTNYIHNQQRDIDALTTEVCYIEDSNNNVQKKLNKLETQSNVKVLLKKVNDNILEKQDGKE